MKELHYIHFQILLLQNQIGFSTWIKIWPNCGDNFFTWTHQNSIKVLLRHYTKQSELQIPWLKRTLWTYLVKKKEKNRDIFLTLLSVIPILHFYIWQTFIFNKGFLLLSFISYWQFQVFLSLGCWLMDLLVPGIQEDFCLGIRTI